MKENISSLLLRYTQDKEKESRRINTGSTGIPYRQGEEDETDKHPIR